MHKIIRALTLILLTSSFSINAFSAEVNVYSARKENLIKPLLDQFSAETGIKTNLITAKADKLLTRMINEGRNTPADVLITTDAGRLFRAKDADLLQPINSQVVGKICGPACLKERWLCFMPKTALTPVS